MAYSPISTSRCWVAAHMCVLLHFRTCDVRAERGLQLCVRCACVRLVFRRAMCDRTFAHFLEQKRPNNAIIGPKMFTFRK